MPELPDSERLFALGIAAMFGSLLVHGLVAFVVGRSAASFEAGAAAGMVLFGLTALAIGTGVAWIVLVQSVEFEARAVGCEVHDPEPGSPVVAMRRHLFAGTAPEATTPRRFFTALEPGECPPAAEAASESTPDPTAAAEPAVVLRVRKSALQSGLDPVPAERVPDRKQAPAVVGVFGAFGGFWFLAGLTLVASWWESRRPARPRPVSAARERWGTTFVVIGNLLLVGCLLVASLADWDAVRSTLFAFRGVSLACVFYAAAYFLRRKLSLATALILLIIGGGFGLAAWSLQYLG